LRRWPSIEVIGHSSYGRTDPYVRAQPFPTGLAWTCWPISARSEEITVHLDAGYDSGKTRQTLADHGLRGQIAHKGEKAPIQASRRWHVEPTNAWRSRYRLCMVADCQQ
jgi:hypothetical protein